MLRPLASFNTRSRIRLSDQEPCLCMLAFWSTIEEFSSVGYLRLGTVYKNLCHCHDGYLSGPSMPILTSSFRGYRSGFGHTALNTTSGGRFTTFSITLPGFLRSQWCGLSCGWGGQANWLQIGVLCHWFHCHDRFWRMVSYQGFIS